MENGVSFFYFTPPVTESLSLLFFNIVAPPEQRPDHSVLSHVI